MSWQIMDSRTRLRGHRLCAGMTGEVALMLTAEINFARRGIEAKGHAIAFCRRTGL